MTRFKINGVAFPKDPIVKPWNREEIFTRGDRRRAFTGFNELPCDFPTLTVPEYAFFHGLWMTGSFFTLTLPSLDYTSMFDYTGSVIVNVSGQEQDVEGFVYNVRVVFEVPV